MSLPLLLLAQAAAPVATPAVPPWTVRERTNPDASSSVAASAIARDGSSRLVVKCDRGADPIVSIQFTAKQPLQTAGDDGAYADKAVAMRFDGGPAIVSDWQFRANTGYIADVSVVTTLTTFLAKARTATVETTNGTNFTFSATFNVPASDAPLRQVLIACGYTLGAVPPPLPAKDK